MTLYAGAEPEYFLVKKTAAGGIQVADELDDADLPCYDAKGLTRSYEFLTTLSSAMNKLGWSSYANDHEDGNGQFEQNFAYADALTTADRVIIFRYMVHSLAQQQGMLATFMPKPFTDRTGTGLHLHLSLWDADGKQPLFRDDGDQRKLGLSTLAYQFIGGVLEHAPGLAAVAAEIAASPALHAGKTYWLTGPELISNYDVAAVLSRLLGRTVTYSELSFDENRDAMIRAGVPAPIAEMNAQAFALTAHGDAEWVTGDVPSLLDRPARSFGQFVADYAPTFS